MICVVVNCVVLNVCWRCMVCVVFLVKGYVFMVSVLFVFCWCRC